ncbi:protein phosphatase 2C domain-containing protein [Streptomyces sp. BE308]|uniref:protein phosphatase 2C domain-containing protein n=1 Tax=Streptomyces sp. BE308 TaxID=3002529 RepID=UPI002E76C868|nr:protein phosphatase 2C domain-containing protein [Streptomyces sp. BE308]MEE1794813.1 protein phosphatase 2C domain-containing protein [Streptomyces sp. BE308]
MNAPVDRHRLKVPAPPTPFPAAWAVPRQQVAVGTPGPEFEARPPGQYACDVPDTECDGRSTPVLCIRFASVRGAKHRYYRQPRQDAARAAVHEATGSIVFAVADGVSSAANSELGAVEACKAALERTHRGLHGHKQGKRD